MATRRLTDTEVKLALADHQPITLAGLTFADISGPVRVDLPANRDVEAVMLTEEEAERLCVWLTFRFEAVREYIRKLQRGLEPVHLKLDDEFLSGPTLGQRIKSAVHAIRQSNGKLRRNGDASWLAGQLGCSVMTAARYFTGNVPRPEYARKIAKILGWPQEYMDKLIVATRLRQGLTRAKKTP